ncbi:related to UTP7 - nucleolar protein, component of the small subunit processome [Melanopsichium pennsylvanicum]|uniref:U three protein 7 n=2 Tax=Melanopsichium pennsylvanicum TaxID=63383 RepID=A0AAJ4XFP1_9BASI|nr:bing4ct-domain-containing protein [Melanopsichium pennsylvanicum 4]SNX81487.1 related to UTP7 - nucleolar protein, component of the small subunit processome [Melanopsichium pennsylvanicum]
MEAGPSKPRKGSQKATENKPFHSKEALDKQSHSISTATSLPRSIARSAPSSLVDTPLPNSVKNIKDKKLKSKLTHQHLSAKRAAESARLANEYLNTSAPGEDAGMIETEGELERTFKVTQTQIRDNVGIDTATKGFDLKLDGGKQGVGLGPYRCDYTRNGRHLVIGGRKGHLAAFDWQTGKLSCEIQVRETVRDVKWLHSNSFFAAAQKKYVYIYDDAGIEIHKLKQHTDVNRLEFLPYHFLLASVGATGWLKYQDTSTGTLISQHRTGLGNCNTMTQNPLTAVLHLGHTNGTVTMWTPNLSTPAVKLLAHRGPVTGISIDSRNGAREMATCGMDGTIKVWDMRMLGKGPRREWQARRPASDLQYSQRGLLGVAWGPHVSVYDTNKALGNAPPGPYITQGFPKSEPLQVKFCPFEDVVGVAHSAGFTSLLVPGAGEPNFDSSELDPFETRTARREREVHQLLDKISPDLISIDQSILGSVHVAETNVSAAEQDRILREIARRDPNAVAKSADGRAYSQLSRIERMKLDDPDASPFKDDEEFEQSVATGSLAATIAAHEAPKAGQANKKEKNRMRGKNKALSRYLRKKRENVIDPNRIAVKARMDKMRKEEQAERKRRNAAGIQHDDDNFSALDMFKKRT